MNYIIFKTDGSVLKQNIEYYVQQGNSGDEIFVGYQGALLTDGTIALFTLPNAEQTQNTVAGVYTTREIEIEGALVEVPGWVITLTQAQTLYYGLLMVAIRIARDNSVIVSYPFYLVINETGVRPDSDTGVTIEEINSYLLQLQAIARGCIRFYNLNQNTATIGDVEDAAGLDVQFAMIFNNCLSICSLSKDINGRYTLKVNNPYGIYESEDLFRTDTLNNLRWTTFQTINDNLIEIPYYDGVYSGTLSAEDKQKALKNNAYILYNNVYYRKLSQSSSTAVFVNFTALIAEGIAILNRMIQVDETTGNWSVTTTTASVYTQAQVNSLLATKQDKLVAGDNIIIEGNVISATGGGSGLTVPTFDAQFEGQPEFEDFQLTQTDLNDIWTNKYPLINIRVTIEDGLATTYYIICFKLSHNVDGSAITYAMTSMEFSNDDGHQYDLDCMSFIIALDEGTNLPIIAAVNEEYYTNDYRKLENKPNIPEIDTTISAESLDDRVPSSKCVYDNIQNVREVAEGKCKTYILSYGQTINDVKDAILNNNAKVFLYNVTSNIEKQTPVEITSNVSNGDYDNADLINSSFNSQSEIIFRRPEQEGDYTYLVLRGYNSYAFIKCGYNNNVDFSNKGDIFLVTETNVPDRWSNGLIFFRLETSKVDLSGYVTLDTVQRITAPKSFFNNSANNTLPLRIQGFDNHTWGLEMDKDFGRLHFKYADANGTNISNVSDQLVLDFNSLFPAVNKGKDLGTSSYAWKDLYLAGSINGNGTTNLDIKNGSTTLRVQPNGFVASDYFIPLTANGGDLGISGAEWRDLYLSGAIKFSKSGETATYTLAEQTGGSLLLSRSGAGIMSFASTYFSTYDHRPIADNTYDLGTNSLAWRDLYLSGSSIYKDGSGTSTRIWKIQETNWGTLDFYTSNDGGTTWGNRLSVQNAGLLPTSANMNLGLGNGSQRWGTIYVANISDGTNTIPVADLIAGAGGTNVVANPTLAGTESDLTGLEVAGTKYRVPQFEIQSNLKGKKISFIGDSITTYSGYLPSGNATRYPRGAITSVDQTWWKQLIDQTGMVLGQNCAWDGSTCIGRSTSTTNAYGACSAKRISQLGLNGNPDIIICFIGINDWGATYNQTGSKYGSPFVNGAFVPVGSYTGETAAPSGDLQTFSEAYGSMIYNIQVNYPNAKIYCCTLLQTNGKATYNYDADGVFPSINRDGVTLAAYNECIRTLAKNIGAEVIEFAKCGINWGNITTYLEDGLHPNVAGMKLLCAAAKAKLETDFGYTTESFTPLQTFSVTNNLTNVTNSNNSTTASENTTYSASLIVDAGYTISNVTITMGGTDITSSAYSNGAINIGNVTGNIVITASATLNVYSITNSLTNVTNSNQATSINHGNSYSATLTMPSGYNMQSVSIEMGGVDITNSVYSNNEISISSVTGNIIIIAVATNQTTYTITNNLSNVTNSNASVSIIQGSSYSATLTPATHYELLSGNVSITMGGTDVTGTVYNSSTGAISIASVTGALVINATATIITHTITNTLTHTTNSNNAVSANDGSSYSGTLTADTGYNISSVSVTMGGVDITSTAYNNGVITISSVTGNIVIQCVSTAVVYSITNNLTNATSDNAATTINYGSSYSATITATSGYQITSASVTMGGVDITSTAYNNGVISIASVTGNLVITITAADPTVITWYTNFSQTSTNSFVASSRGWALDETTYANIYNKPINRISLVATASSGSIDLCVAPSKDAQSGFTQQQTINWTSANKSGNIVTLELPNTITLSNGQYLCVYVNSTPATGVACYASGGNAGQFYSYVGSSGHGTWGSKGSYSIQMNIGYKAS